MTEIEFPKYTMRLNVRKPEAEVSVKQEKTGEVYRMWLHFVDESKNVYRPVGRMTGTDAGILSRLLKKHDVEMLRKYFHTFWMVYADRINDAVPPMVAFASVLPQIESEYQ